MSFARLVAHGLLALCLAALAVAGIPAYGADSASRVPPASPSPGSPASGQPMRDARSYLSPVYPHLANYNGLEQPWQVPFFANYDLVVGRRGAPIKQLTRANPHVLTLLYERSIQADLCCTKSLYGLTPQQIPARWWLMAAGSRLATSINAKQTWITVTDPRPFARCQDVMVDGESMHVWSVDGKRLHVLRGYYSRAVAHHAGAQIAPHYSYRVDLSNCRLSGRAPNPRPWSLNLSSTCPRWHGQRWIDFLAHRIAYLVRRDGWRGIFYDNLPDFPQSRLVDVNDDLLPDGGVIDGENVWREGERDLLAETRRLLPHVPLMVNGDLVMNGLADGREIEQFPLVPGLSLAAAIDSYLYDGAAGMPLTIVNGDTTAHPTPSASQAQLTVGVSLLGDGYASYDYGWLQHGFPWWFDEYDGGKGSALTAPVDTGAVLLPVAHPERFHNGDVVFLDQEAARVISVFAEGLLVQRGVMGTPPAAHLAGTVVTTAVQRSAGHGYLGQPLGPARVVQTMDWSHDLLPLSVAGPGSRSTPITASSTLRITPPHVYYDPGAVRLTLLAPAQEGALRTLVFSARGPAGHALWIDCAGLSVPLVLRSTWHRYVLPMCGAATIALEAGRAGGTVKLRDFQLVRRQAYVLRRDFTRGVVFVNPTDVPQHVALSESLRVLAGDGNPSANNGHLTRMVRLARYQAQVFTK